MIADWTVEVGAESPSIDVPWKGWVDLRECGRSQVVGELPETRAYPELGRHLQALNNGVLLTSKVDVFPVSREEVDPEIAEYGLAATAFGLASYLDVLPRELSLVAGFERFESVARIAVARLSKIKLASPCVAEVVVRPASLFGQEAFGWTLYAVGFGATEAEARAAWAAANAALVTQVIEAVAGLASQSRGGKILSDGSAHPSGRDRVGE